MSGVHKNPTISFRITEDERRQIEAKIIASGMSKKDYFARSCIYNRVCVVGKKETVYRLVEELREIQTVIQDVAEQMQNEETTLTNEGLQEMQTDFLNMLSAILWMLDGARYCGRVQIPIKISLRNRLRNWFLLQLTIRRKETMVGFSTGICAEREVSMYYNDKNLLLCGLDHGFSTMKGTHAIFDNGVERLGGEATLSNNTLVYDGKNYKVGEGRLPMMKTKTEDESYFLLTLAGVCTTARVPMSFWRWGFRSAGSGRRNGSFVIICSGKERFAFSTAVGITGFALKMCWCFHSAMLPLRTECGCMVQKV